MRTEVETRRNEKGMQKTFKRISGRNKGWSGFCVSCERKSLKVVGRWTSVFIFRAVEVACPFPFGPARALGALSSGGARRNGGLQDLPDM